MPRDYGEVSFSLTNLVVASYNILTDTVGTAVTLPEPQTIEFGFEGDTDQIKAQGYITHLLSVMTHGTFTISSAGIPYEALATIAGATRASSGSSYQTLQVSAGGAGLPYFTLAGKMVGEQGDDVHVGLVCCKLDTVPSWTFEQNKFVLSEASGKCIAPNSRKLVYIKAHGTAEDIDLTDLFA